MTNSDERETGGWFRPHDCHEYEEYGKSGVVIKTERILENTVMGRDTT